MPTASHRVKKAFPTGNDTVVGKSRQTCRSIGAVMRALHDAFGGIKVALQIALRTQADPRTAERWLAGTSAPDFENFCELLRSDVGDRVLAAVMGAREGDWPAWYGALTRQSKLSSLRRDMAAQKRALEALEEEGAR